MGALTLMTNCPASVRGKNDRPTSGIEREAQDEDSEKPNDDLLWAIQNLLDPAIVEGQHLFEAGVEPDVESRSPRLGCRFRLLRHDGQFLGELARSREGQPIQRQSRKRTAR